MAESRCAGTNDVLQVQKRALTALTGFFETMLRYYKTDKAIAVLDSSEITKNKEVFPQYKGKRIENKGLKEGLLKALPSLISKFNKSISFVKAPTYEADQVIAYLTKKHYDEREVIIHSGDKDLIQLTSFPNVYISDKFEKGSFILKTDDELFEKFKNSKGEDFKRISTNKKDILKFRTLRGDSSDNIPAVFLRIKDTDIVDIIKNYWVTDVPLSEEIIEGIIGNIRDNNEKLASKLLESKEAWLRNYKLMDLLNLEDIKIKKVVLK